MVNELLATVVRQFDPGPSAPMIHDLVRLMARHRREAKASGDLERAALADLLLSKLEPYMDLAEAQSELQQPRSCLAHRFAMPPIPERLGRDYNWYAVPVMCHGTPMAYLKDARAWSCTVCGKSISDW